MSGNEDISTKIHHHNSHLSDDSLLAYQRALGAVNPSGNYSHEDFPLSLNLAQSAYNASTNPYQIVKYADRSIVLFNLKENSLAARKITPSEEYAINKFRLTKCPLCSQAVDPREFNYMANSYFQILHEFLNRQNRREARENKKKKMYTQEFYEDTGTWDDDSVRANKSEVNMAAKFYKEEQKSPRVIALPDASSPLRGDRRGERDNLSHRSERSSGVETDAAGSFYLDESNYRRGSLTPSPIPLIDRSRHIFSTSGTNSNRPPVEGQDHSDDSVSSPLYLVGHKEKETAIVISGRGERGERGERVERGERGERIERREKRVKGERVEGKKGGVLESKHTDSGEESGDEGGNGEIGEIQANPFASKNQISNNLLITGYYERFFKEKKLIGRGSFGQVYLCYHQIDDLLLGDYAIKKIPIGNNKEWLRNTMTEVKVLEKLHHSNLVEYKHCWLEEYSLSGSPDTKVPWLFLLMELCNSGDLEALLFKNGNYQEPHMTLPDNVIWKIFLDILQGLEYLFHSGFLHRDMKLSNILLHTGQDGVSGKNFSKALLADFGTASMSTSQYVLEGNRRGYTGTEAFSAPEVLRRDDLTGLASCSVSHKIDIWSLGVILYGLCYNALPFGSGDGVKERILGFEGGLELPEMPERGQDLRWLILALMHPESKVRPSVDEILGNRKIRRILGDPDYLRNASVDLARILEESLATQDTGETDVQKLKEAHRNKMKAKIAIQ